MIDADLYLSDSEKVQYEEQQIAAVGLENSPLTPSAEPQPQITLTDTIHDTMQAVTSEMADITQTDIEAALLDWKKQR